MHVFRTCTHHPLFINHVINVRWLYLTLGLIVDSQCSVPVLHLYLPCCVEEKGDFYKSPGLISPARMCNCNLGTAVGKRPYTMQAQ